MAPKCSESFLEQMIKNIRISITGKVQGVWFRGSMQHKARELGLTGFVKNEPDGSVQAEVEGEEAALERIVKWCAEGPELAIVQNVAVTEGKVVHYTSFDVLR